MRTVITILILSSIALVSLSAVIKQRTGTTTNVRVLKRSQVTKRVIIKYIKVWRRLSGTKRPVREPVLASWKKSMQELLSDPEPHPQAEEWSPTNHIRARAMEPRVDSTYLDNVTLEKLPQQPRRKVLMQLSIIVQNSGLTDSVNNATIACLANSTSTREEDWGAYNADRFTQELVQVEYYAVLPEAAVQSFAPTVDRFIHNGNLTSCLQNSNIGFSNNAAAFAARVVTAPGVTVVAQAIGTPAWVIGIAIGVAAIIGIIVLVVAAFRPDSNGKSEHDIGDDDETTEKMQNTEDFIPAEQGFAEDEFERALRSIAGPGRATVSAAPR